jgi:hypothetical protein
MMSIIAGVALMIGVLAGQSGSTGPADSQAQSTYSAPSTPSGTPESEVSEEQPRNNETKESLVVSDNSGTVNIGGVHHHHGEEEQPDRTPAREVQQVTRIVERTVEVPIIVEREVRVETQRPARIWTRPGIPEDSRLGRTMKTLQRFENAGVRLYAEN